MTTESFALRARALHRQLQSSNLGLHDMRTSESLETRLGDGFGAEPVVVGERDQALIAWIEPVSPFARPVPLTGGPSPIRYFLDGSQRTLPGYHCAAIPLMASVTAAAILERQSPSELRVPPHLITIHSAWIAPKLTANPDIRTFIERAESAGQRVIDPLEGLPSAIYNEWTMDYAAIEQRALTASRQQRAKLEHELLRRWQESDTGDSWLVADGALHDPSSRTIGLVKSFTRQYVTGGEAEQLFQLPEGYRTPAFVVHDRWRSGEYSVWYLRFRDARGRDPRHSLVRVELSEPQLTSGQVDAISSWLLAERAPRATADSRWATLLYPIHYLEQILKRSIDYQVRHWPGAGATA